MRMVDVRGADVAVHIEGSCRSNHDLVLVHGAGFDHNAWRFQVRFLAGCGYRVVAPDLPGHGESGGSALTSIGEMSAWLLAFIKAIGSVKPILIGHSMGSLVALAVAANNPEAVSGIVLIATSDRMAVHPELLRSAADRDDHAVQLMTGWMHTGDQRLGGQRSPGLWSAGMTRRLIERNMDVLHADLKACDDHDPMEHVGCVSSPTLVILGDDDHMTTVTSGKSLANAVPGATLETVPGVGHMLMSEASAAVNNAIVEFAHSTVGRQ